MLNPGELGVHDVALHAWIALFGSGLASMRALSAVFGVLSILLVFIGSRELFTYGQNSNSRIDDDDIATIAGLATLVFAVNLVTIKYSREARMYPLMLAAILAQVAMFLRSLRLGGFANYAAVTVLTVLAMASNFAAMLIPDTETLWLVYLIAREGQAGWRLENANARRASNTLMALAACGPILMPKFFSSMRAVSVGSIGEWRKVPAWYEPFALFNKATGSFAFPILAALAILGAIAGWRRGNRNAIAFALLWMWAPPLMMLVASYAIAPVFIERYALSCFVPLFILVAVGIFELPGDSVRVAALAIAVTFSIGHIVSYDRKPHDAQYREAIAAADAALKPGETMTVVPAYAIEVLRYYLPHEKQNRAVRYNSAASTAAVLILGDQNLAPGAAQSYRSEYPQEVARLRGVTVMRR